MAAGPGVEAAQLLLGAEDDGCGRHGGLAVEAGKEKQGVASSGRPARRWRREAAGATGAGADEAAAQRRWGSGE